MARTEGALLISPAETDAGDAHAGAAMLALLIAVWGAVSLLCIPRRPFGPPSLLQVVVCTPAFFYFFLTRKHPNGRLASAFSAALLAYSLMLLPWTAVQWCALRRPWEAMTVPQIASVAMVMVLPHRMTLGITILVLFTAESFFVMGYARHVGLAALVPVTEPYATLGFAMLGLALFLSRRKRRALTERHIVVQSEVEALRRVTPLFSAVRADLSGQIATIDAELRPVGDSSRSRATTGRALARLSDLCGKLDALVSDSAVPSSHEAEQRLLDRDAQFGITVLAAIGTFGTLLGLLVAHKGGARTTLAFGFILLLHAAILARLLMTRRRPSRARATWALILFFVTALPLISYNQLELLQLQRPFLPLFGHKLAMVALGLTAASRFGLSLALILLTAADALSLYYGFHFAAHKDLFAMAEPWVTLVFLLIALVSLWMRELRRIASVRLLRAETEAATLHRRARMFLALRDRLNSPLQILVVGVGRPDAQLSRPSRERVEEAVTRLVGLSRDLARLDTLIPEPSHTPSLDADRELRPRR